MARALVGIEVEGLFGRYDYTVDLTSPGHAASQPVALLYGDNGTGKTTILEIVFHLLSPHPRRSHKSYLANVPFRRAAVTLSDRSVIFAERPHKALLGDLTIGLSLQGQSAQQADLVADGETNRIRASDQSREARAVLELLSNLDIELLYLSDDRNLQGDPVPHQRPPTQYRTTSWNRSEYFEMHVQDEQDNTEESDEVVLTESIRRAEQWLQSRTILASSIGETDARDSYATILQTIAQADTSSSIDMSVLEGQLEELVNTSESFANIGLGSRINPEPLWESVKAANSVTKPVVLQVLTSFLDGQQARLNALQAIYNKVQDFVRIMNTYFHDKYIVLDVSDGLKINIPDGTLQPHMLSSGETHLLLLFLSVFSWSDRAPLFLIDEPELSLNVKWQRQLVDSLIELSKNSDSQFIMATHSIELLAKHSELVTTLGSR